MNTIDLLAALGTNGLLLWVKDAPSGRYYVQLFDESNVSVEAWLVEGEADFRSALTDYITGHGNHVTQ